MIYKSRKLNENSNALSSTKVNHFMECANYHSNISTPASNQDDFENANDNIKDINDGKTLYAFTEIDNESKNKTVYRHTEAQSQFSQLEFGAVLDL